MRGRQVRRDLDPENSSRLTIADVQKTAGVPADQLGPAARPVKHPLIEGQDAAVTVKKLMGTGRCGLMRKSVEQKS
jgi:hypothetical protein